MNDALRGFLATLSPGLSMLASAFDFGSLDFVQESAPVIDGARSMTVSTDDISFSQSTSTGMATTVVRNRLLGRAFGDADAGASATSVSAAGVEFVKQWEGFVDKLYNDPVGHCTVGYGTLVHLGNCDGRDSEKPYLSGVSKDDATKLLASALAERQKVVTDAVKVALNQNQNDALVSFVYNVGNANFQSSTLLKLLNQGKYDAVPGELKKWTKARRDGKLVDLPGLVNRRTAEATLFNAPPAATAQPAATTQSLSGSGPRTQHGGGAPVRSAYHYHSPSSNELASAQSNLAFQQNPAVVAIGVADAIQIGLGAVAIVQAQVNATQGSFTLFFDQAQRMLTSEARAQMPGAQPQGKNYKQTLFYIGVADPKTSDILNMAYATVTIAWGGDDYGEIATANIERDLDSSTDWQKSTCNLNIKKLDKIPPPNTDPRTWPIVFTYVGTFDPSGNGYYEFRGEFEINAFGGLKFNDHHVVSRSYIQWGEGDPENYVRKGKDAIVPVPPIPAEQQAYLRTKLP
jgi:GH24 family phage-related lysozyme (muramidase)